jgi:hypothetical protein
MTPEQKRLDKVARGVGFAGYVGAVKEKLGFKIKHGVGGRLSDD